MIETMATKPPMKQTLVDLRDNEEILESWIAFRDTCFYCIGAMLMALIGALVVAYTIDAANHGGENPEPRMLQGRCFSMFYERATEILIQNPPNSIDADDVETQLTREYLVRNVEANLADQLDLRKAYYRIDPDIVFIIILLGYPLIFGLLRAPFFLPYTSHKLLNDAFFLVHYLTVLKLISNDCDNRATCLEKIYQALDSSVIAQYFYGPSY